MPVTLSAKKALRRDQHRAKINLKIRRQYKEALKKAKKSRTKKAFIEACSSLDKAVKKKVIHRNKAARLKSRLTKLLKTAKQKTKPRKKKKQTKKIKQAKQTKKKT